MGKHSHVLGGRFLFFVCVGEDVAFFFLLNTKADLQYNAKQLLINAVTEANNTMRV